MEDKWAVVFVAIKKDAKNYANLTVKGANIYIKKMNLM